MADPIIIFGRSGTGKSTAIKTLAEQGKQFGLVNVLGKRMPFRGKVPQIVTTDYNEVKKAIAAAEAKTIIVDDCGYLITDMFMTRHSSAGKGNGVFALYNDLGDEFYKLLRFIAELDDGDKLVYLMLHEDMDDMGRAKIKTIGKLLDEKVTIEGMVSVVFQSVVIDGEYRFRTNGDGIVKTPPGMFEDEYIPNDLAMIDATIREYWSLAPLPSTKSKRAAK